MNIKRTERGWAGHFICADRCQFRRNTLLECGTIKIIVSTVGAMMKKDRAGYETVGCNRYFETAVFHAKFEGMYWDVDVERRVEFSNPWFFRKN